MWSPAGLKAWPDVMERSLRWSFNHATADRLFVGFADDVISICSAVDSDILEIRVNDCLKRVKGWLNRKNLTTNDVSKKCQPSTLGNRWFKDTMERSVDISWS